MSFLAKLAQEKSVPDWFLKATNEGLPENEIFHIVIEECRNSTACRENPVLWSDEMIDSFARFLFNHYSASLKN